jgi:pimeloyl-ACP methyl ester carboxylesterase
MQTITSKDGTKIAYDKLGQGPAVILVSGTIMARSGFAELAQRLASDFTVYNYDRRGRGDSTDTQPFAVDREIEDIETLIDEAGGSAFVYGISSGASLAMEAAAVLGDKVKRLAMYEASYDESEGAAEGWRTYRSNLDEALAANRHSDAIVLFMKMVGVPDDMITSVKNSSMWPGLEAIAPTLRYDAAAMGDDRSAPVDRAVKVKTQTLVMDGGASFQMVPFMRATAEKLAKTIPNAQRRTIEGQGHDISPDALAPVLIEFFSTE